MCGFFFGQTPLIVLSPRKTVEGYLGGGLATMVLGLFIMMMMKKVVFMKVSKLRCNQVVVVDILLEY